MKMQTIQKMGLLALSAGALLAGLTMGASAQGKVTPADRKFLTQDAQGGAYELASAKLAAQQASSPQVKQYAQMLVSDHEKFNAALQQLGQQEGLKLPTTMTVKDSASLARLSRLHGAAFDKAYTKDAMRINQEDATDSKREKAQTKDVRIKSFQSQFAAMDEKHLQGAQALQVGGM